MRVLVTGGAGFIGSHLTEALVARGDDVWVLDDLSTGSLSNLAAVHHSPRMRTVVDTILNRDVVADLVSKVEVVYHLAAAVGVKYVVDNPLDSLLTNVRGTDIVLEEIARRGTRLILFSTSEVYGRGNGHPLRETDDRIMGPTSISRWGYAASKAVDEFLAFAYHRERRLPVVIVRCFNTCGPRQSGQYGMVVPRFVQNALTGDPLLVYGDGKQSRCFSYVGDVVRGVMLLAESPQANGQVFNVGSDEEVTILDLARRVCALTGSKSPITVIPYEDVFPTGFQDMYRRVPDLTKIRAAVGYTPQVSLDELLRRTIAHVRAELNGHAPQSNGTHAPLTETASFVTES
jgi:UDP-glucose 4-epimerase